MKILKAAVILFLGPAVGIFIALILGAFALPPDPNFTANGSHAAPGDGFLVVPVIFVSLVISVPLSLWKAVTVLLKKSKPED